MGCGQSVLLGSLSDSNCCLEMRISFMNALCSSVPPTIIVSPTSLIVRSGRSFGLNCETSGYPTPSVKWKMPDAVEHEDYTIKDGKIEFHNAKGSQNGAYKCLAENTGGNVTRVVNVTVLGK